MLLGNRRVAVHPAPAVNGGQGPPEAVLRRLSLEHPAAGPGESPVVREPQNVEPVGLEFRIRSLNRGLGHHCVAPEF